MIWDFRQNQVPNTGFSKATDSVFTSDCFHPGLSKKIVSLYENGHGFSQTTLPLHKSISSKVFLLAATSELCVEANTAKQSMVNAMLKHFNISAK
jgi:hypothetical protein